jgi:YVTN family beta-propeller protein
MPGGKFSGDASGRSKNSVRSKAFGILTVIQFTNTFGHPVLRSALRKPCTRCLSVLLLCLFLGSCFPEAFAPRDFLLKPPLVNEGEVVLYLQPLPQEAGKLRFEIDAIFALKDDGSQVPLSLLMNDLNGADLVGLQKWLASGILPPGRYGGISIQIRQAFVETAEGEVALEVAAEPLRVEHSFDVQRQKSTALFLSLDPAKIITRENRFTPMFSLATPGGLLINLTAFVSNPESNIILVFNKKTMQVVDAIAAGQGPRGLVIDRFRTRAYVAVSGDDEVLAIDVFKRRILSRLKLNFGDNPVELALSPDGRRLVAVNHDSNTVSLIDAFSLTEAARIRVGNGPTSAVMDPSGSRVYVMNTGSQSISVVDLTQKTLVVTIGVEAAPLRGGFNREGDTLFVISSDSPYITAIDRVRLAVKKKIFAGTGAVSLKVDNQSGLVYVGRRFGDEISVIDPFSLMFVDTFRVGGKAVYQAIDQEERALFVALSDRRILQKINLTSKKLVAEIEVGKGAYAIAIMGQR